MHCGQQELATFALIKPCSKEIIKEGCCWKEEKHALEGAQCLILSSHFLAKHGAGREFGLLHHNHVQSTIHDYVLMTTENQ